MQVLSTGRPRQFVPGRASIAIGIVGGSLLVGSALALGWLVFTTPMLGVLMPTGRLTAVQVAFGMLGWTVALAAPASFALLGASQLANALSDIAARRPRPTPAVSASAALGDEYAVAVGVRLPDVARPIDELVIGPFGAAIIEELPPVHASRHRGRHWEVRTRDGRWRSIDNPLERAARDAESVRRWFSRDDSDHVVKVFTAIVATDPTVERTSECAVLGPGQVATWIAGLPAQRMLTADRRERILKLVRDAV